MLERKNIDRVFQESFKDLEIHPSKQVWNNIENSLNETNYKKTISLWQRLSGVAIILVLFLMGNILYNTSRLDNPTIKVSNIDTGDFNFNNNNTEIQNPKNIILVENKKTNKSKQNKKNPIYIKNPNNKVIVTNTDISTIYESIENKYIINKEDFIKEININNSIANNEANKIEETLKLSDNKKWSVGPTVAPVYYNSLQSGSPLNDNLSNSAKTADDALSVGIRINYQLTKKIQLQSGVNKVELAYNTKNVNAYISTAKNARNNINTNKSGIILTPSINNRNTDLSQANTLNKSNINGDLNQSIEYFELPLEMKYNLYDKKIGLNLVGGFSTFFLTNNSVSIVSQNSFTDLGQANNLNNINFSGNFGVDLDYKISKSWYLNVAPMFKYQFNTYSNNSGNFRPYYFGVYSGLNYKF